MSGIICWIKYGLPGFVVRVGLAMLAYWSIVRAFDIEKGLTPGNIVATIIGIVIMLGLGYTGFGFVNYDYAERRCRA